jgi:hypothetical protein
LERTGIPAAQINVGKGEKEMMKNLILGVALGALVVMLALVFTGKLVWSTPSAPDAEFALLERSIEAHTPKVLEVGGEQVLCLALTKQSGKSISVDHALYILKDGELQKLSLTGKN